MSYEQRNIHELLKIILNNSELIRYEKGLCDVVSHLEEDVIISTTENDKIQDYIRNNRPFLSSILHRPFYWKPGKIAPRKRWLKRHIQKTKNQ